MTVQRADNARRGISPSTEANYRRVVVRFSKWVAAQIKQGAMDIPQVWVEALKHYAGHLSLVSWRLYRAALSWHLRQLKGRRFTDEFEQACLDVKGRPRVKRRKLTRRIDSDVLRKIVAKLRQQKGINGKRVADLLLSMVATGIRPNEWQKVSRPDSNKLIVVNAKYRPATPLKPARGNGPTRELIIDQAVLGTEADEAIDRTVEWMCGKPWKQVQARANKSMRAAVKSLVAAREIGVKWASVRIYDARHQFSADAKANLDLFGGEVAAAMGHSSGMTAILHYGQRRHASGGKSAVRPSQASVQAVRKETLTKMQATMEGRAMVRAEAKMPKTDTTPKRSQAPDAVHSEEAISNSAGDAPEISR